MNIEERLKTKREEILETAAKHGAYNVRVFGSVARREADSESDVDFLVEMEAGRSLLDLGGLLMDYKNYWTVQLILSRRRDCDSASESAFSTRQFRCKG